MCVRTPILTTTFQTWRCPYLQFQKLQGISGTHPRSQASSFLTTTQATRVAGPPKDPGLGLSFQSPRGSPGIPQLLAGQHPAAAPLCPHTAGRPRPVLTAGAPCPGLSALHPSPLFLHRTPAARRPVLPGSYRPAPRRGSPCPSPRAARSSDSRFSVPLPVPGSPPPARPPARKGLGQASESPPLPSPSASLRGSLEPFRTDVFLLLGNSLPARSGVPFPLPTSW